MSEVIERLGVWLHVVPDLRLCPRQTLLATRRTWNNAVTSFPEFWPFAKLTVEYKFKGRYVLPWSAFPASLFDEAKRRKAAILDPDLKDPDALDPVGEVTAKASMYEIRRLASPRRWLRRLAAIPCRSRASPIWSRSTRRSRSNNSCSIASPQKTPKPRRRLDCTSSPTSFAI